MRRSVTFGTVTLVCASLLASTPEDILHAPELAISSPAIASAAGNQLGPRIATNGDMSLAAWTDSRAGSSDVYATRLDASGQSLDPLGIFIAGGALLGVVWNGSDFAVFLGTAANAAQAVVFVGVDGRVSSPKSLPLVPPGFWMAAGANRVIVGLWQSGISRVMVLDGRGEQVAAPVELPGSADFGQPEFAGAGESEFLVLRARYNGPGSETVLAQRVGFDGRLLSSTTTILPFQPGNAIAGGDGGWAIVRQLDDVVTLYRLSAEGVWDGVTETLQVKAPTDGGECCHLPVIARQGDHYVIGWHTSLRSGHSLTYVAIAPIHGGAAVIRQIADLNGTIWDLAMALRGDGAEIITSASRYGTFSAFDVLGQRIDASINATDPTDIAMSGIVQTNVGASAGRNGFLIAWVEARPDGNIHVLARRVAHDGKPQDPAPIEIARLPISNSYDVTPHVASNGETYLVTWSAGAIQGRRIAASSGTLLDEAAFTIGSGNAVAVTSNGRDAMTVWTGSCPVDGAFGCLFARPIVLAGDPLPGATVTLAGVRENFDPAIASDGMDYLVTYSNGSRLVVGPPLTKREPYRVLAVRLRADGTRIDADPIVIEDKKSLATSSSVVWSGDRYVVAWAAVNELRAARVTAEGAVLDTDRERGGTVVQKEPQLHYVTPLLVSGANELILMTRDSVSTPGHLTWELTSISPGSPLSDLLARPRWTLIEKDNNNGGLTLSATSSAGGFLVVYNRPTTEDFGGTARVMYRVLQSTSRRRAAGR